MAKTVVRPRGGAPLIGREAELERLEYIWREVDRQAQPHLVTMIGEPGIGKSRLVAEFEQRLPPGVATWHGRCLPYGEALGYWALAAVLKEAASIVAEDEPEAARAKLGAAVTVAMGPDGDSGDTARHLALLGGLDLAADRLAGAGDQRVLHSFARRFLEAAARQQPLVLVFDDIQWADDSMLDLIESVAVRTHLVRLLVVTLARPELATKRSTWAQGVPAYLAVPVTALDPSAERRLIAALVGDRGLTDEQAAELTEQVSRSAGGNPLYVEELVAMLAEGTAAATGQVPSLLKMLIAARLDSLPQEERIAIQLASVFGKVFWEGGLRALDVRPGSLSAKCVEALERKDLLRGQAQSQIRDDLEYTFKHDLIRDVAYDRLPKAERRSLHGRAADWLEQAAGDQVDAYYDQLAHHAVEAGQWERAIGFLLGAASRASRAAAHRKAAALLAQAIAIAESLGRRDLLGDLHAKRGKAFVNIALWAEARAELEAALKELPEEEFEQRALALIDMSHSSFWLADIPSLRRYGLEAQRLAEAIDRPDIVAGALAVLTQAFSSDGDLPVVLSMSHEALTGAGARPIGPVAAAAGIRTLALYWLGRFDDAADSAEQGVEISRRTNDTQYVVYSLPHRGLALAAKGKYAEADEIFGEAKRIGREYEIWNFLARAMVFSGGYHYDVYDFAGQEAIVDEACELARSVNFLQSIVSGSLDLLFSYTARGEVGRAESILSEVAETVENAAGTHGWLWRLRLAQGKAELALARGDWDEALRLADLSIGHSQPKKRVKYHAFGLGTCAQALAAMGRKREAFAAARQGVDLIRPIQAPALFVRAAACLLGLEGDDLLLAEAKDAVGRVTAALTSDAMRRSFEAAEPVQQILKL